MSNELSTLGGEDAFPWLPPFRDESILSEVIGALRQGKEAVTYLCRAHRHLGPEFVVAKVYRDRASRSFKNDAVYQEGHAVYRMSQAGRVVRAMAKGSEIGRAFRAAIWADREFEVLETLFEAGSSVPEPFACEGETVVMALVGHGKEPAPRLREADLAPGEASGALELLLGEIERWLAHHLVHGDLSEYNILWHEGAPVVIDFPQAVDPRFNTNARDLLLRDVTNICRFFGRFGAHANPESFTDDLWERFERGLL